MNEELKRKTGERANILFDSIDLEILETIILNQTLGVLELCNKLRVNHFSLKPHIDRLLSLNLIFIEKEKALKKLFLTRKGHFIYKNFKLKEQGK
jgi:predicted transcriptional regulator